MIDDNNSNKAHPQGNIFILGACYFNKLIKLFFNLQQYINKKLRDFDLISFISFN